jgi:hypothetical protein
MPTDDPFSIDYWKTAGAICRAIEEIHLNYDVDRDVLVNNLALELDTVYPNLAWRNVLTDQWPLRPEVSK